MNKNIFRNIVDAQEIQSRAAAVRKRWSPDEKRRRTGLPPDAPARLREYILGQPRLQWQAAPCDLRLAH